jgi:diguanylate cyclase (GGDEF)-like protein
VTHAGDARLALARERLAAADLAAAGSAARTVFDDEAAAAPDRAEAAHLLCTALYRTGDLLSFLEVAPAAIERLQSDGRTPASTEVLRWHALACAEIGRFEQGLASALRLAELAQASGSAPERSLALNALAACFERMGDPWQAERLMNDALAALAEVTPGYEHFVTRNNLTATLIGMFYNLRDGDTPEEATAALERALVHSQHALELGRSRGDPFQLTFVEGNTAEVLLHLGRVDEAAALLEETRVRAQTHGFQAQLWRMEVTRAELLLLRGQPEAAREALARVLLEAGEATPRATLLRLHHALYRAARALGDDAAALAHHESFHRLDRRRSVQQLKAQSQLMVTRREVELARALAEQQQRRAAQAEHDAGLDPLTGVANRRGLDRRLAEIAQRALQEPIEVTAAAIDIDHFKQVNDRHGHAAGDLVLQQIAQLLREHTRADDVIARTGGEEFLVVFCGLPRARVGEVAGRLLAAVRMHGWEPPELTVSLSVGLASARLSTRAPTDWPTLFAHADAALYRAKQSGRDRLVATGTLW